MSKRESQIQADIKLSLPLPPSLNAAYINDRFTNRRIRTKVCKDYINYVGLQLNTMHLEPLKLVPLFWVWWYWPDKRVRDSDNYFKVLYDALKGKLFTDDRWTVIPDYNVRNRLSKDNPRVEIVIAGPNKCNDNKQIEGK
jgi:Holliday junction resolvase RusA-like endonuclease